MSQGIFAQFRGSAPPNLASSPTSSTHLSANMSSGSRKRARDNTNIDEGVEIESVTSSFRHNFPKRSRVALAVENGGSVVSDDEDGEEDAQMDQGGHDTHGDDRSVLSFGHLEDDDDEDGPDDLIGTQIIEKQMREHRENIASDEGVIEEVFCRNFMCHTKLRIKLGPLINFIVGHNGSGKSAVLTALTVCLGESARKTNRGGNLKGMIKNGQESATLAVKIRNRGEGAYKPELFGTSITVERNFSRSGNNGYKLKNSQDKVVSTKRSHLDDLLDYFGLQIDNPINVLTQDLARQLLSGSSPSEKYKFFIRGTRLEDLDRDYNVMEENLDKIQAKLASRKDDIPELKLRYDEAAARKKKLEKAATIGRRLNDAKNQHAWAQVEEQEKLLEEFGEAVVTAEQSVREREEEAQTACGTFDGHDQAHETTVTLAESLREQLVPVEGQRAASREKFDAARAEVTSTVAAERDIREHMKSAKKRVADLERDATTERDRIANAEGAEHAQRLDRLAGLRTAVEAARAEQKDHAEASASLTRARDQAYEAYEAAKPAKDQQIEELRSAERSLSGTQRSQGKPYDGYRPFMEQLVRAIDNDTRWRMKPVGPMGKHVRLLKPEWSKLIEATFGQVLESFVVTNNEDFRMLKDLFKRNKCNPEPQIYIGNPDPLDTTGKTPDDAGLDTILSVLNIDNTLVRNTLIINQAIEQVVLIADRNAAERFMFYGPRPNNVKVVMCKGHNPNNGQRLERSRFGQAKTSPVNGWPREARMQTDREQQIRHQRETVDHHNRILGVVEQQVNEKRDASTKAGQELKRWEREERNLKTAVQQAEDAVEEQTHDIEAHRPRDGRLQELEKQLKDSKDELESLGLSFQDAVVQKDKQSQASADAKHRLDEHDQEYQAAKARLDQTEQKLARLKDDRGRALLAKNKALEDITQAKQNVAEMQVRRDEKKATVSDFEAMASGISRRVPLAPGLTAQDRDDLIERLTRDMKNQEQAAGGSEEELATRWQKAKTDYDDAVTQLNTANARGRKLVQTLNYRRLRWKKFRKFIAYRARFTFKYLLSERNFRGHVDMNHDKKTLEIHIEPDMAAKLSRKDAKGREVKGREAQTLSGGEKSFSTICLLLSIWEAMGSPIRCLDEFDVFMDSVNRASSMSMMIQAARRSVGRQFILITPQSMNNVEMGDDVKVHKMSDPERGQGVLPFTQE
ncbi:Structural maintenance of chromosomes protein 6 [Friedmanniomyces endolithicus]|nr:Structural maintenance of chromosomes protein 6 [Friedmanniomyces endolithicus]